MKPAISVKCQNFLVTDFQSAVNSMNPAAHLPCAFLWLAGESLLKCPKLWKLTCIVKREKHKWCSKWIWKRKLGFQKQKLLGTEHVCCTKVVELVYSVSL